MTIDPTANDKVQVNAAPVGAGVLVNELLAAADDHLVLGHRLSEWCGHAPMLEEDLAMPNMALDMLGQARALYSYAAELEGRGRSEDDIAYLRDRSRLPQLPAGRAPERRFRPYHAAPVLFRRVHAALLAGHDRVER